MSHEHASHHVQPPSSKPQTGPHPEEIDPLGEQTTYIKKHSGARFILVISMVVAVVLVPILAGISQSPLLNVFLGLSPLLLTLALDLSALSQHFKESVFWIILFLVHIVMVALLSLINLGLSLPVNVSNSVGLSLLLGALATAIAVLFSDKETMHRTSHHTVPFHPEKIKEYVQSIEDKAKAINFVVGRVYRASNGGTAKMRERLRIPSEWYNEFNAINGMGIDEQLGQAKVLVRKIRDRLSVLALKEREVFSSQEIAALKHLARNKNGEDQILTVLKTNDRDPVEHYYVSAVEFCDRILEELEKK